MHVKEATDRIREKSFLAESEARWFCNCFFLSGVNQFPSNSLAAV
jgi:hypothetical protein